MRAWDVYRAERARRMKAAAAVAAGVAEKQRQGIAGGWGYVRSWDDRIAQLEAEWNGTPQPSGVNQGQVIRFDPSRYGVRTNERPHIDAPIHPRAEVWKLPSLSPIECAAVDEEISVSDRAAQLAGECSRELERLRNVGDTLIFGETLCDSLGVSMPKGEPHVQVAHLICRKWWRRKLRALVGRAREAEAVRRHAISSQGQLFCSDICVVRRARQVKRNALMLARTTATNEAGQEYTLAELAEKAASNPKVRKAEWYARLRGLGSHADSRGDIGLFISWTLASSWHSVIEATGQKNPKYSGRTPGEGQKELLAQWARARSALARVDVKLYGVRVVEPHHDGTPHWHLCVFCKPRQEQAVRDILSAQALAEDGDEPGAQKRRITFSRARRVRGSLAEGVAAYMGAYLGKNLDGDQIGFVTGLDAEGREVWSVDGVTGAERAVAWASEWGIQQFRFFGDAPVTVWREVWRLGETQSEVPLIESARQGAQRPFDWKRYSDAAGGVLCPRKLRPLRAFKGDKEVVGRYGDISYPLLGVVEVQTAVYSALYCKPKRRRVQIISKRTRYSLCPVLRGTLTTEQSEVGRCITRRHKWTVSAGTKGEESTPWTRVNNCTRPLDADAILNYTTGAVSVLNPQGTEETGVGSACRPPTTAPSGAKAAAAGGAPPPAGGLH